MSTAYDRNRSIVGCLMLTVKDLEQLQVEHPEWQMELLAWTAGECQAKNNMEDGELSFSIS